MGWKAYAIQPDKTRTNLRRPEAGLSCRNDLHGRLQAIGTRCLGSCYGCTDNEWKKGRDKGIPTLASSTTPVTCCSKGSDLATINMPTTSVPIFVPFQLFQKNTRNHSAVVAKVPLRVRCAGRTSRRRIGNRIQTGRCTRRMCAAGSSDSQISSLLPAWRAASSSEREWGGNQWCHFEYTNVRVK